MPLRRVELLSPDRRASRSGGWRTRTRPSTPTAARCASTRPTSRRVAHLERLAAETGHWAELAALYAAECEKLDGSARRSRCCCGWRASTRKRPARSTRRSRPTGASIDVEPDNKRGAGRARSAVQPRPAVGRAGRRPAREIQLAPTDRGRRRRCSSGWRRSTSWRSMDLPRRSRSTARSWPPIRPTRETRAALERMFMGGTDAARDRRRPRAALPRRRGVGEAAPDPRGAARPADRRRASARALLRRLAEIAEQKLVDQVAAFEWWSQAVDEDPSSEQALDELLRLARATHQWDALRGDDVGGRVGRSRGRPRRCGATCCCAWPRASRAISATWSGPRRRCCRCWPSTRRIRRRWRRSIGSTRRQGMYENLAEILRRRIAITDDPDELVALHLRLGRVLRRGARRHRRRDRQLPGGARAGDAIARGARGARAALLPQRALAGAVRRLREAGRRSPRTTSRHGRLLRAHGQAGGRRARTSASKRRRAVGPRARRSAARTRWRWPALADLHEMAGRVERADRGPRAAGRGDRRIPSDKIPLYKRLGRIWGEKLARERNALESWQKVLELDPQDVEALRAIAANYRAPGAWEELSQTLRRLIQVGQLGGSGIERRAQGAVRAARRARGRDPDAHRRTDRRLARGAGARRRRLPRAGRAREAVHAGGALGGVRRDPRAARARRWPARPSRSTS